MTMRVDFLGLEAFLAIAESGSFLHASARLNLSQTALSHRIKKIETELGVKLFTRTTRSVSLTPIALELLPKLRALMRDMEVMVEVLRKEAKSAAREISIGCLPTLASNYLPHILKKFKEKYPNMIVKIYDKSAQEIAEAVQNGSVELGITLTSAAAWDLEIKPIYKEPFVLVVHKNHSILKELFGQELIGEELTDTAHDVYCDWRDIAKLPLVRVSVATGNRPLIDEALGAKKDSLNWCYEVQHIATALSLVRLELAAAIVPKLSVLPKDNPDLRVVHLKNPLISRSLGILTKRGLPLNPATEDLIAFSLAAIAKSELPQ